MKLYPFTAEKTETTYIMQAVDVPEAMTEGGTLEEAEELAKEALSMAMEFYIEAGEPLPEPTEPKLGDFLIPYIENYRCRIVNSIKPISVALDEKGDVIGTSYTFSKSKKK
jgi:predicted RNase H-like HicB family nuclease